MPPESMTMIYHHGNQRIADRCARVGAHTMDRDSTMSLERRAYIAAVVAALLWGGNFVVLQFALRHFDPYLLAALRFAFVALLVPFVGWPGVPWPALLCYAACSGIGQYLLSTMAIQLGLSPGLAALLMQFQVFISLALGWLMLGESIRATTVVGCVLGLAGLAGVLVMGGSKAPLLACAVCLISAAGWAVASVTMKRYPEGMLRLQCATGLICLPVVSVVREVMLPAAPSAIQTLVQAPLHAWLPVAYLVLASFVVAQVLWGQAIGAIGIAATAPFALLIPVFGVTLAWLFAGENLSLRLLMSVAVVLLGLGVHVVPLALRSASGLRERAT
ncbi:DMT family transporter [Verminephrobacter aporrectodeae]|uniref:DMT family transporter n=1 Tax=Verminephrobacter aporrectodeae TaxID=1110389 RepID=UPI002243C479|nr:EamA family transporter [Verminephrobacter aporrectodeae]